MTKDQRFDFRLIFGRSSLQLDLFAVGSSCSRTYSFSLYTYVPRLRSNILSLMPIRKTPVALEHKNLLGEYHNDRLDNNILFVT